MFLFFDDEVKGLTETIKEIAKERKLDMYSYTKLLEMLNAGKLEELRNMLEANIREEAAKKGGNKKPLTIINSMMKAVKNDERMYNKAKLLKDGRFAFIDGHRIFIADIDFGFKHMEDDELQLVNDFLNTDFDSELEINMQDVKERIALNKANKTNEPYIVKFDDYIVAMSPGFAKDLVDYTGNTKLRYMKKTNSEHHCQLNPLFSVDENGKVVAVILPVFVANSLQEKYEKEVS